MDVTHYLRTYHMTARELASKMIDDVLKDTGITATCGIGTNLYLCKIAMDIMAKHAMPDERGVRIAELNENSYRRKLWDHRPITDFWRVGAGYAKKLEAAGMYTMGDVARCSTGGPNDFYNEEKLYKMFGINAELLIDPCAIACEPFRQWVIEDNFVNGRPDWDKVGAQFVADVVPFEMMKLRMLNGSHSFLAYLGYLGGYETIADTMTNPDYRKAAFALMMQEQAPTLSMPEGTDLNAYATLLIERFSNPSLRHRTWQIAMDGSQKLPQRLLDPVRLHLQNGGSWRHLALGVAGWMRYTQGVDEQGNAIDVVDPMLAEFQKINAQYQGADRVKALLGLSGIFADDLPQNADFVGAVTAAYQQLCERGARECVAAL